jgi:hypothetical protein
VKGETSDAGCAGLAVFLDNGTLRVNAETSNYREQKQ